MKNVPLLLGTLAVTILMIVGVAFMFSGDSADTAGHPVTADETLLVGESTNVREATDSAAVTVVEFSDFQCPACKATEPLVQKLLSEHGDDIRFVYRHYPLISIHPNAQPASLFAEAAALQGAFWEAHDVLFDTQTEWSAIRDSQTLRETFLGYAEGWDIDLEKLAADMESSAVVEAVQRDIQDGNTIGISGTPTFFVNGVQTPAPELLTAVSSLVVKTSETDTVDSEQ